MHEMQEAGRDQGRKRNHNEKRDEGSNGDLPRLLDKSIQDHGEKIALPLEIRVMKSILDRQGAFGCARSALRFFSLKKAATVETIWPFT
jgi:hypothetical protein